MYLLLFPAAALVGYAISLPNVRLFVPLVPLTLGWIMLGAERVEGWLRKTILRSANNRHRTFARLPLFPFIVAILVLSVMPLFFYLLRGEKWHDYNGQKQADVDQTTPQPTFAAAHNGNGSGWGFLCGRRKGEPGLAG